MCQKQYLKQQMVEALPSQIPVIGNKIQETHTFVHQKKTDVKWTPSKVQGEAPCPILSKQEDWPQTYQWKKAMEWISKNVIPNLEFHPGDSPLQSWKQGRDVA